MRYYAELVRHSIAVVTMPAQSRVDMYIITAFINSKSTYVPTE